MILGVHRAYRLRTTALHAECLYSNYLKILNIDYVAVTSLRFILTFNFVNPMNRFSPEDKYSRQRIVIKTRFGLMPTQQPMIKY
jgi:hypothetical protein